MIVQGVGFADGKVNVWVKEDDLDAEATAIRLTTEEATRLAVDLLKAQYWQALVYPLGTGTQKREGNPA